MEFVKGDIMDRIGKKLILYYDDGEKITRREIIVSSEDDNFLGSADGQYFNKNRIVRMQEVM